MNDPSPPDRDRLLLRAFVFAAVTCRAYLESEDESDTPEYRARMTHDANAFYTRRPPTPSRSRRRCSSPRGFNPRWWVVNYFVRCERWW